MKQKIDALIRKFFLHKNEELPAFLLQQLFHQGGYLPYTTSSLKFRFLACVANDIVVNNRKKVLELGTGISTVIMARLFKLNRIEGIVYSIDESSEWQAIVQNILEQEQLSSYVKFVHAPTAKSTDLSLSFEYDAQIVARAIGSEQFDIVLIDGPSAWQQQHVMSRASNLKHFQHKMAENFTIFVDNSDRKGEAELVNRIQETFGIAPTLLDPTFTSFSKGKHFNFVV